MKEKVGLVALIAAAIAAALATPALHSQESTAANNHKSQTIPSQYIQCTVCHGVDLGGNFGVRAPRISGLPAWYVENQLQGFKRAYRGWQGSDIYGLDMQPIAASLSEQKIKAAAAFVAAHTSPAPRGIFSINSSAGESTLRGNADRGERVYQTCGVCHGSHGEGKPSLSAPPLTIQNDWYLATQLREFRAGLRGKAAGDVRGAQMQASSRVLADDQSLLDVIAYIATLTPAVTPDEP